MDMQGFHQEIKI